MSAITNPDALARIAAERVMQAVRGSAVSTPDGNGIAYGVTGSLCAVKMPDGTVKGYAPADVHATDAVVYVMHPRETWALRHRLTGAIVAGRRWDSQDVAARFLESLPAATRDMLDAWPVCVRELHLDEPADL